MFSPDTYRGRRLRLKNELASGLVLFLGNAESPANFAANVYPFRQDSSFLYFWGLDEPDLAAVIDVDAGSETIFGNDPDPGQMVWTGGRPALSQRRSQVGVSAAAGLNRLGRILKRARQQGRRIHYLPPYRADQRLSLHRLLGIALAQVGPSASATLVRAVIAQRSIKSAAEIKEIESALEITAVMQTEAMGLARPGKLEGEVLGAVEGPALARLGSRPAFASIFSVRGEILHNPFHDRRMQPGDLLVYDCGAESSLHYASDITRTIPIGGAFSQRQKDIYTIVLNAQQAAMAAIRPKVEFRSIHLLACRHLAQGLKALGLMQGDVDEAVGAGAHALFFPCGLGHMLGLDVHDMEALGEDQVGYTSSAGRSPQFGLSSLRLAKPLETGFVITVEPGIYFIPQLIDRWRAEGRCAEYICYDRLEAFRGFGGIRIEDDLLVTDDGHRLLGRPIPKEISDLEALAR
jgi:Xaa-Pro aminopeptidase